MSIIANVNVFLDDEVPEYMNGRMRIASVSAEDENGNEIAHGVDFVDNKEFSRYEDIRKEVATRLQVPEEIVKIQGEGS